jgi:molybdopterin synthase catalytic subunit
MSKRAVAKIVRYDAAHEIGLVRTTDDTYWIVEGPITTDGPYRWIRESNSYAGAGVAFESTVREARLC